MTTPRTVAIPGREMIAMRADQHLAPPGIADDRRETRPVARDLDAPEPRLGLFGEADRMRLVRDARIRAQSHGLDQPGDEQHRDERGTQLDEIGETHFSPASASIIGRSPLRSYPAFAAASTMASTSSPARARVSAHRCVERVPDRQ